MRYRLWLTALALVFLVGATRIHSNVDFDGTKRSARFRIRTSPAGSKIDAVARSNRSADADREGFQPTAPLSRRESRWAGDR